jgi:hypothetical protein
MTRGLATKVKDHAAGSSAHQHETDEPAGGPDVTARLFDFPPEDLATAGRVLAIVTTRANAELADPEL